MPAQRPRAPTPMNAARPAPSRSADAQATTVRRGGSGDGPCDPPPPRDRAVRKPRPPPSPFGEGTEPRQDGERERRPGRSRRLQCRGPLRRGRDPPPPSRRRRGLALYPCYDGRGRPTGLEARPERFRRATGAPLASHAPADCRTYRLASQPASPDTRTTVGTGFRPLWKRAARRSPLPSRRGISKRCPEFGGIPESLPGRTFRIV